MDINFTDEIPEVVQGTPINRLRMMGVQGYFSGQTTIEKISDDQTRITQVSAEGQTVTMITKGASETTITKTFTPTSGQTINKTTTITKNGAITNITEVVSD